MPPTMHKPWHHHAVRHSAVLLVIALPLACADGVNVSGGSLGEGVGEGPSSQTNGNCPNEHRINADALGIPCAQGGAFQSMCPCE